MAAYFSGEVDACWAAVGEEACGFGELFVVSKDVPGDEREVGVAGVGAGFDDICEANAFVEAFWDSSALVHLRNGFVIFGESYEDLRALALPSVDDGEGVEGSKWVFEVLVDDTGVGGDYFEDGALGCGLPIGVRASVSIAINWVKGDSEVLFQLNVFLFADGFIFS